MDNTKEKIMTDAVKAAEKGDLDLAEKRISSLLGPAAGRLIVEHILKHFIKAEEKPKTTAKKQKK